MFEASVQRPVDRMGFRVAIICALPIESDAVEAMFDEFWEEDAQFGKAVGDQNSYSLGRIGRHNVVLAYLSGMGKGAAASAAATFRASFPNIELALLVGICGAVPRANNVDIFLGDVIVSTGLVQYDFGRQFPDKVVRKDTINDSLGRPSREVRAFLNKMQGIRGRSQLQRLTSTNTSQVILKSEDRVWSRPASETDRLYEPEYRHQHYNTTCQACGSVGLKTDEDIVCEVAFQSTCDITGCDDAHLIPRSRITHPSKEDDTSAPVIHFGLIASGDLVMRSAHHRDAIAAAERVVGFEMEGAGVWDNCPCIVVKAVCDYADSHKNKSWQKYAALTAAACSKAMLREWRIADDPMTRVDGIAEASYQRRGHETDLRLQPSSGLLSANSSLKDVPYSERMTPYLVLSLAISLLNLLQLKVEIENAFYTYVREPDSGQALRLQIAIGNRETKAKAKEDLIQFLAKERQEKSTAKERLENGLLQVVRQMNDIRTAMGRIGDSAMRQFNEGEAGKLVQNCVYCTHALRAMIRQVQPWRESIGSRQSGGRHHDLQSYEDLQKAAELLDFTSSIYEFRSATSEHIVRLLKGLVGDFGSRSSPRSTDFEDNIATFLRVFQNDNSTVDRLVKEHNPTLQSFCDNNVLKRSQPQSTSNIDPVSFDFMLLGHEQQYKQETPKSLADSSRLRLDNAINTVELEKRESVLRSLQYRRMADREDDVSEAYPTTFEWIFDETASDGRWDDYQDFLNDKGNKLPFWANGKAGSGKSTLMKFIASHPKTKSCLDSWAEGNEVVIVSFFFWNLGDKMQKSTQGLFMSILHQVLSLHPELMRVAFDGVWSRINSHELNSHPLTYTELKRAVDKLLRTPFRKFHICLFVDGLDEFEGDYLQLAAFVKSLPSSNIKVVASSRPISECFEIFRECPTLRLEYLTYDDIWTYVDGQLASHAYLLELMEDEPEEAQGLIQNVTESASGVFLWVRLVVRSLLQGLRNGDSLADLKKRLNELPQDLEDLFEHMIERLEPLYQDQAIQYFELFREATRLTDQPLEALDLYYALAGPQECLKYNVLSMNVKTAIKKCETIERRIRSRCCGLLELHRPVTGKFYKPAALKDVKHAWESSELPAYRIQYLHRSVAEFLYQNHIWSKLTAKASQTAFDVHTSLSHALLAKIHRIGPKHQKVAPFSDILNNYLRATLYCEQQYELRYHQAQSSLVNELAAYMMVAWQDEVLVYWSHANENWDSIKETWSASRYLFLLAAKWGLKEYVSNVLLHDNLSTKWPDHIPHLWPVIDSRLAPEFRPSIELQKDMVTVLLEAGADHNPTFAGQTLVERLEYMLGTAQPHDRSSLEKILALCEPNTKAQVSIRQPGQRAPPRSSESRSNTAPLPPKPGSRRKADPQTSAQETSIMSLQQCLSTAGEIGENTGASTRHFSFHSFQSRFKDLQKDQPRTNMSTDVVSTGEMAASRFRAVTKLSEILHSDNDIESDDEPKRKARFISWALAGMDD